MVDAYINDLVNEKELPGAVLIVQQQLIRKDIIRKIQIWLGESNALYF